MRGPLARLIRMTKQEFENMIQALVSQRIAKVIYYEIDYAKINVQSVEEPSWNLDSRFDSLDFGLELVMESGDSYKIMWGEEFIQYGLSVKLNVREDTGAMKAWDVTNSVRWQKLIGKKISRVKVFWSWVESNSIRSNYPQDIEIVFENGEQVFISAFEFRTDGSRFFSMDNITLFFDKSVASEFQIGPYSIEQAG